MTLLAGEPSGGQAPTGPEQPLREEGPGFRQVFVEGIVYGNSVTVTALAIVTGIVLGGLLIAFSDPHVLHRWAHLFSAPGAAFSSAWDSASSAYSAMFQGAVVNIHSVGKAFHGGSISSVFSPISETLVQATPLILASLAVMLPFRAGLFNIGATGQFIGGAFLAGWVGFGVSLPPVIHVVVAVLAGFAGGAIVGGLVGALRARTGANEVIVTIMLNYVMEYLLLYLLGTAYFRRPGRIDPISPLVQGTARLPHLFGHGLRVNAGIVVALAGAAGVAWLLKRSTFGFEFRAIGFNPRAARTAGIDIGRGYTQVFLIAGGLAGLAGACVVLGTDFTLTPQVYGTYGIDGITVALLGRGAPLGVVLAALLYAGLHAGGVQMQASTQTPVDIVTVIQAVIVLFVAAPPLIRGLYRLRARPVTSETRATPTITYVGDP